MYYEKIEFDLNLGTDGKYIFACVVRGQNNYGVPLTSVTFTSSQSMKNICPTTMSRLSQDLNEGSGGDFVYLCVERFGEKGVTDIAFIEDGMDCPASYEKSEVDLNSGIDGAQKVFACVQSACSLEVKYSRELSFREDKTFKIVQFTDSHFGEYYDLDLLTATNVYRQTLVLEDPDVVAITGDAVSGYAWDRTDGWFAEVYFRVVDTMISLGYPYFYLNGNHDPQADLNQTEIVQTDIDIGKYISFTQLGPANITGASNYYIPIHSSSSINEVQYSFWVFDSNQENCEGVTGYGCINDDQIMWYKSYAASLQASLGGNPLPPALAFFHIPLDEYMLASSTGGTCVGHFEEPICCSSVNTGAFHAFKEVGDVSATFVGHDHDNDFSYAYDGITLVYGRKSGYGGYGPPEDMPRGAKVTVIKEGQRGIYDSWVRQYDGLRTDLNSSSCLNDGIQQECCGTDDDDYNVYNADSTASSAAMANKNGLRGSRVVSTTDDKCAAYENSFREKLDMFHAIKAHYGTKTKSKRARD